MTFSNHDREVQETSPISPIYNFWGDALSPDLEFYVFPKRIGKIICGYSDLIKGKGPLTYGQRAKRMSIGVPIGLAIGTALYFLLDLHDTIWIIVWFTIPVLVVVSMMAMRSQFKHTNLYVGVNGFAQYLCEDTRDNFFVSSELNFNDVTDVYLYQVHINRKLVYDHTEYVYAWLNRITGKVADIQEGEYNKLTKVESQPVLWNLYRCADKYFTVYLMEKMGQVLQEQGCLTFCLYFHEKGEFREYIKLGNGWITFIKDKGEEFTYQSADIKKLYTRGPELRIQHTNFERTLFFFKSGDEDVIPLTNLCNREFFFKAVEILLGYTI